MSQSDRIIENTTRGIYNDSMRQTGDTSHRAAERQQRRTSNFALEQYSDALEESVELARRNRELQEQLEDSQDLINFWANDSEAYRRTLRHLKDNWQPKEGAQETIKEIVSKKRDEVKQDPSWKEEKEQVNKRLVSSKRGQAKRKPRT